MRQADDDKRSCAPSDTEDTLEIGSEDLARLCTNGGAVLVDLREKFPGLAIEVQKLEDCQGTAVGVVIFAGPSVQVARAQTATVGMLVGESLTDALAKVDGATVLKNVGASLLQHIVGRKRELETAHKVTLDIGSCSIRVRSATGDPQTACIAKEALDDLVMALAASPAEQASVAVIGSQTKAASFKGRGGDEGDDHTEEPIEAFALDPDFDYDNCPLSKPEFPYSNRPRP